MPSAARLEVRGKDKSKLRSWVRASGIRAGLAQRARIVLLAGEGLSNTEIATRVGVSRPTVIHWRDRYAEGGLAALADRKRSGRRRRVVAQRRAEWATGVRVLSVRVAHLRAYR